jgi:hypothetical protein
MRKTVHICRADSRGRVGLGKRFANRLVLVVERGDQVVVRRGHVVPPAEFWLYENERALESVTRGLAQARAGELTKGPATGRPPR